MADENNEYVAKISVDVTDAQAAAAELDKRYQKLTDDITKEFKALGSVMTASFSTLNATMTSINASLNSIVANYTKMAAASKTINNAKTAQAKAPVLPAKRDYDAMFGAELQARLSRALSFWHSISDETKNAISQTHDMASALDSLANPTSNMSKKAKQLYAQYKETNRLMQEQANKNIESDTYKQIKEDLRNVDKNAANAAQRISELNAKLREMEEDGTATYSGKQTEKFRTLAARSERLRAQLDAEMAEPTRTLGSGSSQKEASSFSKTFWKTFTSAGNSAIDNIKKLIKGMFSTGINLCKRFGNVLSTAFKLATFQFGKLGNHTKSFSSGLDNAGKVAKKVFQKFNSYISMLRTRIRRRVVALIFSDITGTFGRFAQLMPRFNSSVSGVVNSARLLGTQLLAVVEPLASRLLPYFSMFMDVLAGVADRMSQFIAQLMSYNTFIKASKGNYDYASSLDEAANSANKAKKATKDYEATVLGFDQLNKLNGSSGDASGEDALAQIKVAETEGNAWSKLGQKLAKLWRLKKYFSIGKTLGNLLNTGFKWLQGKIGWINNGNKIKAFLNNVVSGINGFIKGIDGKQIGSALADIANTLINSVEQFFGTVDFSGLGTRLADTLGNFLARTDWKKLGSAVIKFIQSAVKTLAGFLTHTVKDKSFGANLGKALREALEGLFDSFSVEDWSDVLAGLTNNFFDFLIELFGDQSKWQSFAEKLAQTINETFKKIDAKKMADGISALARSFTTVVTTLIHEIDWGTVISKLIETLGELDWGSVASAVGILLAPKLMSSFAGSLLENLGFGNNNGNSNSGGLNVGDAARTASTLGSLSKVFKNFSGNGAGNGLLGTLGAKALEIQLAIFAYKTIWPSIKDAMKGKNATDWFMNDVKEGKDPFAEFDKPKPGHEGTIHGLYDIGVNWWRFMGSTATQFWQDVFNGDLFSENNHYLKMKNAYIDMQRQKWREQYYNSAEYKQMLEDATKRGIEYRETYKELKPEDITSDTKVKDIRRTWLEQGLMSMDGSVPSPWETMKYDEFGNPRDTADNNYLIDKVSNAIAEAVRQSREDMNSTEEENTEFAFVCDGEELARIVERAKVRINKRNNPFISVTPVEA